METWLTDSIEDAIWLKTCEFNAFPFKILVQNRKGKGGGRHSNCLQKPNQGPVRQWRGN